MDKATLIGLIVAFAVIFGAIAVGGSALVFVNIPSLLIVLGGTLGATLVKFPMSHTLSSFKIGLRALFHTAESPTELIALGVDLANTARRAGVLGLESVELKNEFLAKGVQLAVDGQEPEFVTKVLAKDINLTIERHDRGQRLFKGVADTAPAMGMIGTLIGLVQMMSNMDDPKSIGPAMAVALLTTLYGAVIANAMAIPLADKLGDISEQERLTKALIIEIVNGIQTGINPRMLEELLKAYLPGSKREGITEKK